MRNLSFLGWPVVSGVLLALVILQFFSGGLTQQRPQIEVKELAAPEAEQATGQVSYADAVANAAPAVVNIYTRSHSYHKQLPDNPIFRKHYELSSPQPQEKVQSSLGSGVILSDQGYIITNNHVIAKADSIVVALKDGREAAATIIGTDPETDLALLKINLKSLPSITLSSSDNLRVGDVVLAIGNPFGVGQTVTMGILSATGRNSIGLTTYENFLQTDAAINPGNSGGALINAYGSLVGINTAIFSKSGGSQGIGFAIPSSLTKKVMQDLVKQGRVIRGWLGVEIQELNTKLAESFGLKHTNGLILAGTYPDGPAFKAGLKAGDILLEINKQAIKGKQSMIEIADVPPGSKLDISYIRNGKLKNAQIIVGERPLKRPSRN